MIQDKPDWTLDTSGTCCPEPLNQAHRAIKILQPGQVPELISTDIGSHMDISAGVTVPNMNSSKSKTTARLFAFTSASAISLSG